MKIQIYQLLIAGLFLFLFLFLKEDSFAKRNLEAKQKTVIALNSELVTHSGNSVNKKDSLPGGFTDEFIKDLRDENGRKIIPEEEGDAFQQRFFNGFGSDDIYGYSVSSAGDVNGDGFDDLIIGAAQNDAPGTNAGRAYVYFGGINVNTIADVILSGETVNSYFGNSVSSAGDVNGDGYSDVIVGAYGYSSNKGRAYIYFGGQNMNNVADLIMTGENAGDYFGITVSDAGDLNGDGFSDVICGAFGYNSYTGRVYAFYGGSLMNNTADVLFDGENSNDGFGYKLSGAGDVNGDGFYDIIIGAENYDSYRGRAYTYFGNTNMDNTADLIMTGENTNDDFGYSVSAAGDINGDGFSDIIISADAFNSSYGKVYIYFGGYYIDNTEDLIITGQPGIYLGSSVSDAGDVNADGYDDFIVGANTYNSFTGRVFVYFGGAVPDNTADLTLTGETTFSYFGSSVSGAGDVNGDGYADLITGAYGFNSLTGKAYLNMYGMNGVFTPGMNMQGTAVLSQFGQSVASAGDVNGDGYPDIIVGAPYLTPYAGNAYIFFGGPNADNIADVSIGGEASDNRFGQSVSGAGDVNGDGYADVIIGAEGYSSFKGRAYILYGGAVMDNLADVILTGEAANNYFGDEVSGGGDLNGDGYADVVVGADGYNSMTGRVYVYYGGSNMNNVADVIMTGETTNNNFGLALSSGGDLNGDGFSDLVVGAYHYNSYTGRAYIFYGGSVMNGVTDVTLTGNLVNEYFGFDVNSTGDLNGDGFSDLIIGAYGYNSNTGRAYIFYGGISMSTNPGLVLYGESPSSSFGYSVSSAGDINGDGFSDALIGALGSSGVMGKAYVFYGGAVMNNAADVVMSGEVINTGFGNSVASAGDLNADGYPDIIVGNVNFNSSTGKTFVYFTSTPNVHPGLLSVTDVPDDQGGSVYLKWAKSSYDVILNGLVTGYLIERSTPPSAGGYHWVSTGTVPANQNTFYIYQSGTPSDNTIFFYRVTALTGTPYVSWKSNILSGSSIDNLAPLPPANLTVMQSGIDALLSWDQNAETDLRYYIIYRNSIQIGTSTTLNFTDHSVSIDSNYIYTIAVEDIHGNLSGLSNPASLNLITADVNIKMIPEGFYDSALNQLNSSDTVRAYLHSVSSPFAVVDSAASVINQSSLSGLFKFAVVSSGSYYIALKHRNSIETWSKPGGESIIKGGAVNYDFTDLITNAFGNNMTQVDSSPVHFAVYSGDVNQDGTIDLADGSLIDNDAFNFISGYVPADVNGDGIVDVADAVFADNNGFNFISKITP
ncbi:MAG: FG-GAP repeat protein [Bacteroidetes bacterium]|nr:FG-GAP repeat protein [Bacteroidota bacterium]